MSYIGKPPAEHFTSFATQTFSVSATTSYTLDHAVANENEIALFVNNVRQQPGSGKAYTATGTALTLSAATATTDTMYCIFLGRALQTVTPATNSITAAMVGNDLISGKDALASEPADTDEFLVSDAGTLKRIDYSLIKGGGITEVDTWRLTSDLNSNTDPITSNLERPDDAAAGRIGTGMTVSSGIFSFPSTGYWQVTWIASCELNSDSLNANIYATINNSNYDIVAWAPIGMQDNRSTGQSISAILDVTDTSNVKVKFVVSSMAGSSDTILKGSTDENLTTFTFIRLGDT